MFESALDGGCEDMKILMDGVKMWVVDGLFVLLLSDDVHDLGL